MRRRPFLAVAAGLFAGCGSIGSPASERDDATVTPAPVPTDEATPDVGRQRFADEGCLTFDHRTHRTVCSHTQPPDASLRLTPDRAVAALDGDRLAEPVRFTLQWSATGSLSVFADSWYLLRKTDDGWDSVATATGQTPGHQLQPGERYYWLLDTVDRATNDRTEPVVTDLVPGRYALGVQTVGAASATYSECLALFDVVASG
jgi:hypothetical protein